MLASFGRRADAVAVAAAPGSGAEPVLLLFKRVGEAQAIAGCTSSPSRAAWALSWPVRQSVLLQSRAANLLQAEAASGL